MPHGHETYAYESSGQQVCHTPESVTASLRLCTNFKFEASMTQELHLSSGPDHMSDKAACHFKASHMSLCCVTLLYAMPGCAVPCYAMACCVMACCAMMCHGMMCNAVLRHAVLCCACKYLRAIQQGLVKAHLGNRLERKICPDSTASHDVVHEAHQGYPEKGLSTGSILHSCPYSAIHIFVDI